MNNNQKYKLTEEFLLLISSHLSSREKYRYIEYEVTIADKTVTCSPYVTVYPSRYKRQKSDKENLIYHILKYHMPELSVSLNKPHCYTQHVKTLLVPGCYRYQLHNKRRHWIRESFLM